MVPAIKDKAEAIEMLRRVKSGESTRSILTRQCWSPGISDLRFDLIEKLGSFPPKV